MDHYTITMPDSRPYYIDLLLLIINYDVQINTGSVFCTVSECPLVIRIISIYILILSLSILLLIMVNLYLFFRFTFGAEIHYLTV